MRFSTSLLCLGLAGCGVQGESLTTAGLDCAPLPLEGRYVTIESGTCHGCAIHHEKQAVDGDLSTYATARIPGTADGPLRLRAGNLGGNPDAASAAGAILQVTEGRLDYESELAMLITLRGMPQASTSGFKPMITRHGALERLTFKVPVSFDELELRIKPADRSDADTTVVRIHEVCRA